MPPFAMLKGGVAKDSKPQGVGVGVCEEVMLLLGDKVGVAVKEYPGVIEGEGEGEGERDAVPGQVIMRT